MEKQVYQTPEITKVHIDNEISVVLMSLPSGQGLPPSLPDGPTQE